MQHGWGAALQAALGSWSCTAQCCWLACCSALRPFPQASALLLLLGPLPEL